MSRFDAKTTLGGRIYLDKENSNVTQPLYLHVHGLRLSRQSFVEVFRAVR